MSKRARILAGAVLVLFVACSRFPGVGEETLGAKVKTAYIFNLLQFVRWPEGTEADPTTPVKIVVVGDDPVGDLLEELSKSPRKGRGLIVVRCPAETEVPLPTHVVFISRSMEPRLPQIIKNVGGKGVLTVSDIGQFPKQGGMVGFFEDRGKIKIEINLRIAREQGFQIDARLLEIARVIR